MSCCKKVTVGVALTVLGAFSLLAQSTNPAPSTPSGLEFPVILRQKIEAGKTLAGTRVEAKLVVATLVSGVVIPQDAILSGEVVESVPRSGRDPSRLAIVLDSAKWKNGSTHGSSALPARVYLTAWYYPLAIAPQESPDLPSGPMVNNRQHQGGAAPYPNPNTQDSPAYPRGNTDPRNNPAPDKPLARISEHRELLKNVDTATGGSGVLTLTSTRSNIKLDKATTYVFATADLGAKKP